MQTHPDAAIRLFLTSSQFSLSVPAVSEQTWSWNPGLFGCWTLLEIRHSKQQSGSNRRACLLLQVCCAQQQLTTVYHLRAGMAPRVWTTWTTTCACALKDQCGSWAGTVRSCLTPASLHRAPTAPVSPGPTSSPATAQMVSPVSTAPRTWTSVRGSHVRACAHFVSTG